MDPMTKKLLIHRGLGGGSLLLHVLWNVYRLCATQP